MTLGWLKSVRGELPQKRVQLVLGTHASPQWGGTKPHVQPSGGSATGWLRRLLEEDESLTIEDAALAASALGVLGDRGHADAEGGCFVSVDLGSDRQVLEVLDTIQGFVSSRAEGALRDSVVIDLDERTYTARPE
jgi:hypothetical protein